uniref:Uncharacterized protein n=1 Tax=Ditylenchus dipsaci TaxID=166011 RepID=A0A915CLB9_9BILA
MDRCFDEECLLVPNELKTFGDESDDDDYCYGFAISKLQMKAFFCPLFRRGLHVTHIHCSLCFWICSRNQYSALKTSNHVQGHEKIQALARGKRRFLKLKEFMRQLLEKGMGTPNRRTDRENFAVDFYEMIKKMQRNLNERFTNMLNFNRVNFDPTFLLACAMDPRTLHLCKKMI